MQEGGRRESRQRAEHTQRHGDAKGPGRLESGIARRTLQLGEWREQREERQARPTAEIADCCPQQSQQSPLAVRRR